MDKFVIEMEEKPYARVVVNQPMAPPEWEELRQSVQDRLSEYRKWEFDLKGLNIIYSADMGMLMVLNHLIRRAAEDTFMSLTVQSGSRVEHLLHLARLDKVFEVDRAS